MNIVPPNNIEAEKSTLGSIIIDNDNYLDISELITAEDFYKPMHIEIFKIMSKLHQTKEPIDLITITNESPFITMEYLVELTDSTPTAANARKYAGIVEQKSRLRKQIAAAQEAIKTAVETENVDEVATILSKSIDSSTKCTDTMKPIGEIYINYLSQLEERCSVKGIPGIQTGFCDLDFKLGGLQTALYLVAGRPSMGKTAFVTNIATFAGIFKNKPVPFFSLEMPKEQLVNRIVSGMALVDAQKLKLGKLDENDWRKIAELNSIIDKAPIIIDDMPRQRVIDIEAKCRRIKQKYGELGMVIIDYLQLITPASKGGSREQEVAEISRSLKILSKELGCPVVCLSQLSRGPEQRVDKRPMLSDLRESGAIEQDADVVMFLYRDDYYNPDTDKPGIAEVIIAKGRNEGTGTIELKWLGKYTKFANLETNRG